ncbi:MAG: beta-phosphoglucomutase [Herpetosiphon sp.]
MADQPRAVLWDMDGTLVDTGELHFVAWQSIMEREGFQFTWADHQAVFGLRNDTLLRRLQPEMRAAEQVRIIAAKEEAYRILLQKQGLDPLPGVRDWLERLQAAGWKMAVASSGPHANIRAAITAARLTGFFDFLASGDDVAVGKPAPDLFLFAAETLGVVPQRCVVVEDVLWGVQAAQAAGMAAIGVGPEHASLPATIAVAQLTALAHDTFEQLVPYSSS